MRKVLPLFFSSVLLLSACSAPTGDVTPPVDSNGEISVSSVSSSDSSSSAAMMEDHSSSSDHGIMDSSASSVQSSASSAVPADTSSERIVPMTVTDWEFSPKAITAKKGEKIIVRLTGIGGVHSFGSQELGLNVKVNPGETVDIEIPTGTAGTFSFRCMIPCGPGHKDMTGTIIIS